MGLLEGSILLFIIITIGQYLVSYAIYLEKRFTMTQLFESKAKKVRKGTPTAIKESVNLISEEVKKELDKNHKEKEEEEIMKKLEAERQQQKEERKIGLRRRKEQQLKLLERTDEELSKYSATIMMHKEGPQKTRLPISGGLWTDEDLKELTRLIKKYPGGTVDRWEIIAEAMNRNISEVTLMAYRLKDNVYQAPGDTEKLMESINKEITKKLKTKSSKVDINLVESWTQEQQKQLELAIQKYPKHGSEDRWLKIAKCVTGKSKEECQTRFKYLVEQVRKQKEAKDEVNKMCEINEPELKTMNNDQLNIDDFGNAESKTDGGKKRNMRKDRKKNIDYYEDNFFDDTSE